MITSEYRFSMASVSAQAGGTLPAAAALPLDEDQLSRFRARQIHTVLQLAPLTTLINLVNAAVVGVLFQAVVNAWLLAAWGLLLATLLGLALRGWLRSRVGGAPARCSPRAEDRAVRHAALLSLLWGSMPAVVLPLASPAEQGLIGCISVGMICAGGFALSSIPRAGTVFPLLVGVGTAVGVLRCGDLPAGLLLFMLGLYVATVVLSVRWTAASFLARLVAEGAAERQRDLVGLLLHDFEEHASDALWETDADGRLSHVSPRLSAMLGRPSEQLIGRPAGEVFQISPEMADDRVELNDDAASHSLQRRLSQQQPFHDQVYLFRTVDSGGLEQSGWVQLAAKPLLDTKARHVGWRGVASNVTREHEAQLHITKLAFRDMVTGLHNRYSFQIRLGQIVEQASAAQPGAGRSCALVCMDLDGFKTVNDALGHDIGDGLLRSVAERLSALLLPQDLFARLGGDEFGFIFDGVSTADEAGARAAQLLDALRTPLEVCGASVPIGASLGIAMVPQDGTSAEVVLKSADLALYAAKAGGRGQYRFFLPQMGARVLHRLSIERALREALQGDQLSLVYQPQLDLFTGELLGFEALLRWNHPDLGQVSPADFVPVAEDAGLIGQIGDWVLHRACLDACTWSRPLRVAVNLSPLQIMAQDLIGAVRDALQRSGLSPRRLEVEVTESVLLNETSTALSQLHALHQLGACIALDDFGTGYSSMAYLRRFPFDKLKIDRAFVRELVSGQDARAIVKAMLDVAAALRMETVAEGVETLEELHALHALGCKAIQGFFLARPMASTAVADFLDRWESHPTRLAVIDHNEQLIVPG
ncbi:MAG: EAL domain-containing protein [Burkholderiales bacterium]